MTITDHNELDLHNHTVLEALEAFISYYNTQLSHNNLQPITIIHGYGSKGQGGKIRRKLRAYLREHKDYLSFKAGEKLTNNPGETVIYPQQALPPPLSLLAVEILDYCATAKTKSKIVGKFRQHGASKVSQTLQHLEKQNQITIQWKGKHKCYVRPPTADR